MRIDKFLKVSRVLKRRTVGKELALNDRILINDRLAKPASEVRVGDIVEIVFGNRHLKIRILQIQEHAKKEDAGLMYEVVDEYRD